MAGFDQGFNKKQWKSPFAHRSECKAAVKKNLRMGRLRNIEKSVSTANNTSLYYMQHERKRNSYTPWSQTKLYQKHLYQE